MSWIHAAALAGLAAVGIPIAIHLMRNRQTKVIELGTLRFLQEALLQTRSRRRIREWLLLLARILAVCLLAFLFARPLLKSEKGGAKEAAVILIDGSASMNGASLGKSNQALAIEAAQRLLDNELANASVEIAVYADTVRPLANLGEAPRVGRGAADHAGAIGWARERISHLPGDNRQVYWITDLQPGTEATRAARAPASATPVTLVDLALPGEWNAAVEEIALATQTVGNAAGLRIRVAVLGTPPPDHLANLVLTLDSEQEFRAPVPANGVVELRIPRAAIAADWLRGAARVESTVPDAWPTDNEQPFAFPINRQTAVHLVDGAPGETRFSGAAYYLGHALNLSADNGGSPRYRVSSSTLRIPADLDAIDLLVLCNVPGIRESDRPRLQAFLDRGGRILYFLGDRCEPALYASLAEANLFPARLTRREVAIPRRIAEWDRQHPALALFDGGAYGDLSQLTIEDYFAIELHEDAAALASLRNDTPCLFTAPVGQGSVTVFSNPADRSWNDFPVSRLFVPFVHELVHWLATREENRAAPRRRIARIGDSLPLGLIGDPPTELLINPPQESRPEAAAIADFSKEYGLATAQAARAATDLQLPETRLRDTEIWTWLALALLVVAISENLLADRLRA